MSNTYCFSSEAGFQFKHAYMYITLHINIYSVFVGMFLVTNRSDNLVCYVRSINIGGVICSMYKNTTLCVYCSNINNLKAYSLSILCYH